MYTDEIFRVFVMVSSGLASSTMKSALLFASIVPASVIRRNCAPLRVAATMTCIGVIPAATMSSISRCGAYGVLPSVPTTTFTPAAVRFADDRRVQLRCQFLDRAHAVVDPELDSVDFLGRFLIHRRAGLRSRCHPVRRGRPSRLGTGDAAARGEEPCRPRNQVRPCLLANLERHVGGVLPQALCGAYAVVRAPLQVGDQHLARLAEMVVRVDDRRDD